MKFLMDWLDHRTGVRKLTRAVLFENIPGGSRWRYVWGSTLTFCLAVQFLTGIFLWMAYSPSAQTAWESVYYIQHEMPGGWFLRGLHHFTAQAMIVLLVLHLMQVMIDGAYRAPREVNFWFGIGLLMLTLGLSLTGYLLPWDQKGFWATQVATNIAAITPGIGDSLHVLIIGGTEYGHHTLTRFFAWHAGVLPALIVLLVVGHIALFRRHGIKAKEPLQKPDTAFWPDQVLKDGVACLAVLAAVTVLTVLFHGAELYAPADPSEEFSAARPEWYFLFLFEFLKYFPGGQEVWGAIYVPAILMGIIALMPWIGRWKIGHGFNIGFLVVLLIGAAGLTGIAMWKDYRDPEFARSLEQAKAEAHRAVELVQARGGVPEGGAIALLREDPMIVGPRLFAQHCASCHRYDGHDGLGRATARHAVVEGDTWQTIADRYHLDLAALLRWNAVASTEDTAESSNEENGSPLPPPEMDTQVWLGDPPSAPDLKRFGSREWVAGLLDPERVDTLEYFGGTKFREGKMVRFVQRRVARKLPDQADDLASVVAALSAEAELPYQDELEAEEGERIESGRHLLREEFACIDCHAFRQPDEDATAPDLTGWGSRDWLIGIIRNPAHEQYYGKDNDRMPAFGEEGILDDATIGRLADWLRLGK